VEQIMTFEEWKRLSAESRARINMYDKEKRDEIAGLTKTKDGAYHERNMLVAALSKVFPSSLEKHIGDDWDPGWGWVVFIDLPTSQVSWHIHDSELPLFDHLPRLQGRTWDGHTTEEKYARLAALKTA
jgi:hypothetical protein